jgi:hypothetical protein
MDSIFHFVKVQNNAYSMSSSSNLISRFYLSLQNWTVILYAIKLITREVTKPDATIKNKQINKKLVLGI